MKQQEKGLSVLIIEDELHNYRLLKGMVEQLRPTWNISGPVKGVKKAIAWLGEHHHPDLIFMDIQLMDDICFAIFDEIKVESMVIFTTAYDEFALQAFKVNSIDYLLKPIKESQLEEAIIKFEHFFMQGSKNVSEFDYQGIIEALKQGEKRYRKRFLVAGSTSFTKIDVQDIALFYTENRITYAVTFDGHTHHLDYTMEKLEEQLDPEVFFRANRSHIVNGDAIDRFETYFGGKLFVKMVHPITRETIISRLKAMEFKEWWSGKML
jgi:DNA-binding LytR/AlgR family response regulator